MSNETKLNNFRAPINVFSWGPTVLIATSGNESPYDFSKLGTYECNYRNL